jgi:Helix-turn-helix domain/F plasmid transfer operon, TraF, protein
MKAYRYRIYPSAAQEELLEKHFGCARHIYNWGLSLKEKFYQENQKNLSRSELQRLLVASKKAEKPWLAEVNSQSLLSALMHLEKASQYQSQHKKINVDLGLTAELSEQLTVGVVGKNLLRNKLATKTIHDKTFTYQISPVVTAGAAYCCDRFTVAADVDLTPIKAFSNQKGSQYAGVGAEWEPLSWAKLRTGYRIDMKKSKPNMATVGFGFHPGEKVKFDITGMAGSKRNLGASLQLSVTI